MIILCDIDGVIADVRKYVNKYLPHDWKTYLAHTSKFEPVDSLATAVRTLHLVSTLHIGTSRPESNREATKQWLSKYVFLDLHFPYASRLHMRRDGDIRHGHVIKMEWLRTLNPDFVIDDDPEMVKAARKAGVIVLQVHGLRATAKDDVPKDYL
jgi:uncharacterized HAD superfamily protein